MQAFFYQAECGDAARIRYCGNDGAMHNIMIDSGYKKTFRHILSEEINSIIKNGEKIDLWLLSHIHDDHIGGVKKYLDVVQRGELEDIVESWYYNPPRLLPHLILPLTNSIISSANSIKTGDDIYKYLLATGKLPELDVTSELPAKDFFGLKFIFLTPLPNKLLTLREKYRVNESLPLEKGEFELISFETRTKSHDYHIPLEKFDLDKWKEDESVENGSSISFLTEYGGKRILWLADSHPSDVVNSLTKLGYSEKNKLRCDWVKVTHHGSSGNNSNSLFDIIECNNYLVSVNGENIHYLPTKECLARIIRNRNRPPDSHYTIYFTYYNTTLRKIFEVDGIDTFIKWKFKIDYLQRGKFLKIDITQ